MKGLTNQQKKLLKPRDRKNKSEEARWKAIYKICFPNDEFIPSPCKSICLVSPYPILIITDYIYYSRETAHLRRDVLTIVEEETRYLDNTVRDRLRDRLQHAFNNAQIISGSGIPGLPTPLSSDISSQLSSSRSPLAPGPAPTTETTYLAPAAELEQIAMAEDQTFSPLQGDVNSQFFDSELRYHVGENGEDDLSQFCLPVPNFL
jgi:hypothetical protein